MKWVPFTAHIKITPANPNKRFAHWRDMQKIANLAYEGLETIAPDTINIASPGGGQHQSFSGISGGGMGGMVNGCAVKPQIGESPAQLQITGFYNSTAANAQPHPSLELIHAGESLSGPGKHSWEANPTTAVSNELKALKAAMEGAIAGALPGDVTFSIFRIDYAGVIYGDRGYHFPL